MFSRFEAMWLALGGHKETCRLNFDILEALYSQPGRRYHNLDHVKQCLDELEQWEELNILPNRDIEFALWYHDAIYCTDNTRDNERESALLAYQVTQSEEFEHKIESNIADLIIATRHDGNGHNSAYDIIADIDLSILGKKPEIFHKYCDNIRKEYAQYSDNDYKTGRIKVLNKFLNKERIYNTTYFHTKYEKQARKNITKEIKRFL